MGDGPEKEAVRAPLLAHLKEQRPAIEEAIVLRVHGLSDSGGVEDQEYAEGLRNAVAAGVDDGLAGIEWEDDRVRPVPVALLAQARLAARNGVTLDLVLRRYIAGYTLFSDFVMEAAGDGPIRGHALRLVMHGQAARFERLVLAATGEYNRECGHRRHPPERHEIERVKQLLAGDPNGANGLAYEMDDWHIGAIARGEGAARVLRRLADAVDRRLLLVRPAGDTAWAWFGGRRRIAMAEVARRLSGTPGDALIALGEPARGVEGWRLTHEQASAALRITRRGSGGVVLYADVGLMASISQDPLLARSLHQLYLAPLADGRDDGGAGLRETLRAYFAAGSNISSAASALGVSRQTVRNRLRTVEGKLNRTIESCAPELQVALRLDRCGDPGE
ncbi:MAG TPA: helix-turn-helix domain-containing protein [Solirubrobacterales bacterium]|nr:helix-turn-helix domain-containing protein [Solirubrobacterales bacterium]